MVNMHSIKLWNDQDYIAFSKSFISLVAVNTTKVQIGTRPTGNKR